MLAYGFAYGSKGTKLIGKDLQLFIPIGSPEQTYASDGYNNFTMDEFLRPLQQTGTLSEMNPMWLNDAIPTDPKTAAIKVDDYFDACFYFSLAKLQRRQSIISITKKGQNLLPKIHTAWEILYRHYCDILGEDTANNLNRMIVAINTKSWTSFAQ